MAAGIITTRRALVGRGVLAFLLAVAVAAFPDQSTSTLAQGFGLYVVLDGAFALTDAIAGAGSAGRRGLLTLEGALDLIAGVVAIAWLGITAVPLLQLIGAWAVLGGLLRIDWDLAPKRRVVALLALFCGAVSWLFGAYLVLFATDRLADRTWAIALYALVLAALRLGTVALTWADTSRCRGADARDRPAKRVSRPHSA